MVIWQTANKTAKAIKGTLNSITPLKRKITDGITDSETAFKSPPLLKRIIQNIQ